MIIKVKTLCETDGNDVGIRTEIYEAKGNTLFESFKDYIDNWNVDNVIDCDDEFDGGCNNEIKILSVEMGWLDMRFEINIKSEEVIDNVIDELQRARDRILELTDFNYDSLSDDEDLIEDINRSIDRLIDLKGEI